MSASVDNRAGIRAPAGKLHVARPGLRPLTRCGLRLTGPQIKNVAVADVPVEGRCARCFPGSGQAG